MDTLFTALRVAVSLALVIGLIWFVQRRSASWARKRSRRPITVIAKQSLGGKSRVVIVEADGTHFVLGVTDSSVVVLTSRAAESSAEALAAEEDAEENADENADEEEAEAETARQPMGRHAVVRRPSFADAITSAETWKKAAQSLRSTR